MEINEQDGLALYEAGKTQVRIEEVAKVPVVIAPREMQIKSMEDLVDARAERPLHLNQKVVMQSAESFIAYINRYGDKNTTVFADLEKTTFVGVIDYHEDKGKPRHGKHTVVYSCPKTNEWNSWIASNNEKMDQDTFSMFIEDNLKEIIEPDGAVMLEIAQTLKAKIDVDFRSSKLIDNGQTQLLYHETINGQAGIAGELTIPNLIVLAIRPFQNGAPYQVQARFRYRITQGHLKFWYTLVRPNLSLEDAAREVYDSIIEGVKATTSHVYIGVRG